MKKLITYICLLALLVILQTLVFSHLQFRGSINAFPYIYLIIVLPFSTKGRDILLISALLGFTLDFFTGNMGVHMAATIFAGYCRTILLPLLIAQNEWEAETMPSVSNNGWGWFMRYTTLMVLIHHFILFLLESFSLNHLDTIIFNSIFCGILSLIVIVIIEFAITRNN